MGKDIWIILLLIKQVTGMDDHTLKPMQLKPGELLNVTVNVNLRTLAEVKWTDPRVGWNRSDDSPAVKVFYSGRTGVSLWTPTVIMMNSVTNSQFLDVGKHKFTIDSNGFINARTDMELSTHCQFDMRLYPFDTQVCAIKAMVNLDHFEGPAIVYSNELRYQTNHTSMAIWKIDSDNIQWELMDNLTLQFLYPIKRVFSFGSLLPVTGLIILAILTVIGFQLPVGSGERIAFGMSLLTILVIFLLLIHENINSGVDGMPLLATYYILLIAFESACVINSILVLKLYHGQSILLAAMVQMITKRKKTTDGTEITTSFRNSDIAERFDNVCYIFMMVTLLISIIIPLFFL